MTDRSDADERSTDEPPSIAPETLADRLRSGDDLTVLDVRDRDEFERWHLEGEGIEAVQIPHMKFIQAQATGGVIDLVADLGEPIVAVCGRGEASAYAVGLLREAGVDAANLAGGMDAWADLYLARELEVDAPATVVQYDRPSSGCLSYAIYSNGEVAVIDPLRAFADRYVDDAADRNATIEYAIDTHVHADHVSGVRTLGDRAGAESVVPVGATDRGLAFDASTVEHGDELRIGDATLTAVATPGHTTESVSYRLGDLLFTGDTLFLEGVGRPDLEESAAQRAADSRVARDSKSSSNRASGPEAREQTVKPRDGDEGAADIARELYETLRDRLESVPNTTTIAPGHYSPAAEPQGNGTYTARLGALRERLEAFSMDEAAFVERATSDLPPRPANHERIVAVNLGREEVDRETAFELELGPNNCAVAD
ncbi:MBL fold metallo-hydrolase [Haloterrigena alkaliphila]|uniref:MBL fold metallo-hydrolase n=1 Tax=Haloterrigena alkaliphila TaxID=2816475 RepID=A0A8A2VJT3_9EURY|nr:MBL fold metallo-hydrolase [Haloterrigena alkaliphila]QSW98458.1 MBL fold metallo-hydrolase [Haloterrigena alkaliphila]